MKIDIPNVDVFNIENIVFDFNGTLATDGKVPPRVYRQILGLTQDFNVYIITADTFDTVKEIFSGTEVQVKVISKANGSTDKKELIETLNPKKTMALGNGSNDALMLESSGISIAVLGNEGLSLKALENADLMIKNINDFFEMMKEPKKLIATLRQ
jgi:soluble P-type ATPase